MPKCILKPSDETNGYWTIVTADDVRVVEKLTRGKDRALVWFDPKETPWDKSLTHMEVIGLDLIPHKPKRK